MRMRLSMCMRISMSACACCIPWGPAEAGGEAHLIGAAGEGDRVQHLVTDAEGVAVAELAQHRPGGLQPAPLDEQRVQEQKPRQGETRAVDTLRPRCLRMEAPYEDECKSLQCRASSARAA